VSRTYPAAEVEAEKIDAGAAALVPWAEKTAAMLCRNDGMISWKSQKSKRVCTWSANHWAARASHMPQSTKK